MKRIFPIICVLLFFCVSGPKLFASESLIINEAKSEKVFSEKFDATTVLGKPSVEVKYFKNTSITCYVGHDVTTLVKLPYQIVEPPVLANADFFKIQFKQGWNYFIIKPAKPPAESLGQEFNMHIICRDDNEQSFIVDVTFVIVKSAEANHTFEILDGAAVQYKSNKSLLALEKENTALASELKAQDSVLHYFLYNELIRTELNQSLTFAGTTLTLQNITNSTDYYFYNLIINSENFNINELPIKLTFANYRKQLLSESRDQSTMLKPIKIIKNERYLTLVFQSAQITPQHYYSDLEIGTDFRFRNKIDRDESFSNADLFGRTF